MAKSPMEAQLAALMKKKGKSSGAKESQKGRKIGRMLKSQSNARYKGENRAVKNKQRKMIRHARHNPDDIQIRELLDAKGINFNNAPGMLNPHAVRKAARKLAEAGVQ